MCLRKNRTDIVDNRKLFFFLPFRSAFTTAAFGEDRMRLGNARKIGFFLAIPLGFHYLCMFELCH